MTAAGVGSLLICQRQLATYRDGDDAAAARCLIPPRRRGSGTPVRRRRPAQRDRPGGPPRARPGWPRTSPPATRPVMGQSPYYGLYGIERIGALADRRRLGRGRLVRRRAGASSCRASRADGALERRRTATCRTPPGRILFLTKSTAKTLAADRGQAARGGDAARGPGAAEGPVEPDGRRRPRRQPADERRGRGDARRAGRPPGRARRLGPRRPGRPLPGRGPGVAPAATRTGSASC